AMFATAKIGGVVVPVSTLSTPVERDHILRHADVSVLITQTSFLKRHFVDELLEQFPNLTGMQPGRIFLKEIPNLRHIVALGLDVSAGAVTAWKDLLAAGEDVTVDLVKAVAEQVHPTDDAVVIYTSGSTALPKGVVHRHMSPC